MEKVKETREKSPFKVPENYFDKVTGKIIAATSGSEPEEKKSSLYERIKPYLAVAAFISGFILIGYTALKLFRPDDMKIVVPQISLQEFSDVYLNDIEINTLEEISSTFIITDEIPDVSKSDIIDYLIRDNINIDEIYEQL